MDFEPINQDHAIQSVTCTVTFDRPIGDADIAAIRRNHRLWRSELPAMMATQAMVLKINDATAPPEAVNAQGVEFAHVRADSSRSWTLRIVGQEITVECHRYTRWARVWDRASQYFHWIIDIIEKGGQDSHIANVSLGVRDVFKALSDPYDLKGLFRSNPLLPEQVFSVGPTWHNHSGWFRIEGEDPVLNLLFTDARREPFTDLDSGEIVQSLLLSVLHNQQYRLQRPRQVSGGNSSSTKSELKQFVENMHQRNKGVMQEMLVETMQSRIKLNG